MITQSHPVCFCDGGARLPLQQGKLMEFILFNWFLECKRSSKTPSLLLTAKTVSQTLCWSVVLWQGDGRTRHASCQSLQLCFVAAPFCFYPQCHCGICNCQCNFYGNPEGKEPFWLPRGTILAVSDAPFLLKKGLLKGGNAISVIHYKINL